MDQNQSKSVREVSRAKMGANQAKSDRQVIRRT